MKFLGLPEVFFGGKPLKFATRKALALFAYLVVESGAQPREKLMSLFWPESETHLRSPLYAIHWRGSRRLCGMWIIL